MDYYLQYAINPFDVQAKEISELKTTFDDNLLTISKQLEFLQKSLRKREKSIGSTIRRKDKVRSGSLWQRSISDDFADNLQTERQDPPAREAEQGSAGRH